MLSFWWVVIIASILFFIPSCRDKDNDCSFNFCSDCQIVQADCTCLNDSINFHCPPSVVHGVYSYGGLLSPPCGCSCIQGWVGANCDQRDPAYYIRFWFGSDTAAMSNVRTSNYTQEDTIWKFYDFSGVFPAGGEIDSIIVSRIPALQVATFPLCGTDSACIALKVVFTGPGKIAYPVAGNITVVTFSIDIINNSSHSEGTFTADIAVSGTGENYYIRDGRFYLPLD